jgi:hypothetical protein
MLHTCPHLCTSLSCLIYLCSCSLYPRLSPYISFYRNYALSMPGSQAARRARQARQARQARRAGGQAARQPGGQPGMQAASQTGSQARQPGSQPASQPASQQAAIVVHAWPSDAAHSPADQHCLPALLLLLLPLLPPLPLPLINTFLLTNIVNQRFRPPAAICKGSVGKNRTWGFRADAS